MGNPLFFVSSLVLELFLRRLHLETDISTSSTEKKEHAWFSGTDGHEERSQGSSQPTGKGTEEAHCKRRALESCVDEKVEEPSGTRGHPPAKAER